MEHSGFLFIEEYSSLFVFPQCHSVTKNRPKNTSYNKESCTSLDPVFILYSMIIPAVQLFMHVYLKVCVPMSL